MVQARTKCPQALGLLRHFHCKFPGERALLEILLDPSLEGPGMILHRSLIEDLVEILEGSFLRGPCMKILQMPCLRGACMKAFVGGSGSHLGGSCLKIL